MQLLVDAISDHGTSVCRYVEMGVYACACGELPQNKCECVLKVYCRTVRSAKEV